ncbi:ABC transporter ATP-binding protein [uncultured Vibrio sp.]|uniref:ABC transporter ATP-binding protein n=1 Tax=uncultured Vibrio sp. TaxID=114054 RepID=UPI0025DA05B4|nr:sn-glycerol-3-phosphate ABC transporter ATP-binding protein UgpC [uncultured Vibrio sp.]
MTAIALKNIDKTYSGDNQVIHDVNMDIKSGEFIVIVGPSGCGKSTLLRMIAGLEHITNGDLLINNKRVNDVSPQDRDLAFVFQNYALYPHLTVRDNIAFSLELRGMDKQTRHLRADEVAKSLRLSEHLDKKPGLLSGGQRQRVAMGRAIARDAGIYLMDEPLSNLDAELRNSMRAQIKQLHRKLGNTTVYVTHDQVEALTLADKIAVMKGGVLQQYASPEDIYDNPANVFVASFIGSPPTNILPLLITQQTATLKGADVSWGVSANLQQQGDYLLGIRPDKMSILEESANKAIQWQAKVELVETTGSNRIVHCVSSEHKFLLSVERKHQITEGQLISVGFNLEDAFIFDSQTELRVSLPVSTLSKIA